MCLSMFKAFFFLCYYYFLIISSSLGLLNLCFCFDFSFLGDLKKRLQYFNSARESIHFKGFHSLQGNFSTPGGRVKIWECWTVV